MWGSSWGLMAWGGIASTNTIAGKAIPANTKPLPTQAISATVLTGGASSVVLSDSLVGEDIFAGRYLVHLDGLYYARKVERQEGDTLYFDRDFPSAIPNGSKVLLVDAKTWGPDEFIVGLYPPSKSDRILPASLQVMHHYGRAGMEGIFPHLCVGSSRGAHEGKGTEVGDAEGITLSDAYGPSVPVGFWASPDAFRGLLCEIYEGEGIGQIRRIVSYDETTKRAYFDRSLDKVTNTTSKYRLRLDSHVFLQHLESAGSPLADDVLTYTYPAGITLQHDGLSIKKNVLTFSSSSYKQGTPVHLRALFFVASSTFLSGQTGLTMGFRLPLSPTPLTLHAELMHDGGGGAGNLVLRVFKASGHTDVVLDAGASGTGMSGRLFGVMATYAPSSDKLYISVEESALLQPDQTILRGYLEIADFRNGGLYNYESLPGKRGGAWGWFSAGRNGAATVTQLLRFAFASEGGYLLRDGRSQGIPQVSLTSTAVNRTLKGRTPLQWHGVHRPLYGRMPGVDSHAVSTVRTDPQGKVTTIRRSSTDATKDFAMLVHYSPKHLQTNYPGFSFSLRAACRSDSHIPYDSTGMYFGVVVGSGLSKLDVRVAFLRDLNRKCLGILLKNAVNNGLYASDYLLVDDVDWESEHLYQLLYDDKEQRLLLYVDNEPTPRLNQLGALSSWVAAAQADSMSSTGCYVGITDQQDTDPSITISEVEFTDSLQMYDASSLSLPPSPNVLTETHAGTCKIAKESVQTQKVDRVVFDKSWGTSFYTLNTASLSADEMLTTDQGLRLDFGVHISGEIEHANYVLSNRLGFWAGPGVIVDDGSYQTVFGLADGGSRGKLLFVCSPPLGSGTRQQAVESWLEEALRYPQTYQTQLLPLDWTSPADLTVLSTGLPTTDQSSGWMVFKGPGMQELLGVISRKSLRGMVSTGTPSVLWGHLVTNRKAKSVWRGMRYMTSTGITARFPSLWSESERAARTRQPSELMFGGLTVLGDLA